MYRIVSNKIEVLLAHPGGPFWKNKDMGAWSIPKGEYSEEEEPLAAAFREFSEETGLPIEGKYIELNPVKQRSGKLVRAWAVEDDPDISDFRSNSFNMEWPPKSGKTIEVPEIDKLQWFSIEVAKMKILPAQVPLIEDLLIKTKRAKH